MYCTRKIPEPFRNKPEKTSPVPSEMPPSSSIEAKEKPAKKTAAIQAAISPLAALLFLDIFSNKKGDE